ncbi:MAG: glycosyltransferase [Bacteroidetes bacterium]|nr:MAG: glycosyltransferase [Bacteroidota bacterium]
MKKNHNILVCPLDWGIGHATRCVPIIDELLKQGANVILGADKRPLAFLKTEYPQLKTIVFPGYKFSYPKNGDMVVKMGLQVPKIMAGIRKEHKLLDKIITDHKIDAVISDNRFGLWSKKVPSVFMTHQLKVKMPSENRFGENMLFKLNKWFIQKYDECWVPDFEEGDNLSGDLSHFENEIGSLFFIGPLSRFSKLKNENIAKDFQNDILVVLSGPEPQRTILENKLLEELPKLHLKCVVVGGKTELLEQKQISKNIKFYSHLNSKDLFQLFNNSEYIISRPGYSSIMDLTALGKKAIFIPTPGQTEQEYLAHKFHNMKVHYGMGQVKIDLALAIKEINGFKAVEHKVEPLLLGKRIQSLIDLLKPE